MREVRTERRGRRRGIFHTSDAYRGPKDTRVLTGGKGVICGLPLILFLLPTSPSLRVHMITYLTRFLLALSALTLGAACGGKEGTVSSDGERGGTVVVSGVGEPEHFMPPVIITSTAKQVVDMVFEQLAELGPSRNTLGDKDFVPIVAERWEWSPDSSAITFTVRGNARFHDGRPVTAADLKFSYELYADPVVASPHISSFPKIDSVVVLDSARARFHFAERNPERFFQLTTNLTVVPKHLVEGIERAKLAESPFASAPVGSGPFRFLRWERGSSIFLEADSTRLREKPYINRLIWQYSPDLNAAARAVIAGESDFSEALRPEGIALLKADSPARASEYAGVNHGYLMFNTRSTDNRKEPHPILGDREVRRALAMAVDREAVARNALDTLYRASYGPFQRVHWSADTTIAQIPFSLSAAAAQLDSLGWKDTNGDGVREKGGRPLRFGLLVPSISATRRQMAVVLQEQLKQVGAEVTIESLEPSAMLPKLQSGKFESFIHVQNTDLSPAGISQVWAGNDLERSANWGWYSNPKVDSLIGAASAEAVIERAKPMYREIYETIVQDAPAIFIWEPRTIAIANKRIKFDDLRAEGWWLGIRTWRIPAAERIERDNVGQK